jgi:hypothetical protein
MEEHTERSLQRETYAERYLWRLADKEAEPEDTQPKRETDTEE